MKALRTLLVLLTLGLALSNQCNAAEKAKTRVLIVTGGHDFEKAAFFKVFEENTNITFKAVEHPNAHQWLTPEHAGEYDVVLLYDMWDKITPEAQHDFAALIAGGKGLLAMHHCLAGYQNWPEYEKIIGGKYHHSKWVENGVEKPASVYKHDVDFTVKVSPVKHPVTKGIKDFQTHDETYGGFSVTSDVTPLLTTDEPTNSKTVAWAKTYGKARVIYLQLGHDHIAYDNPNFRQLTAQAINWVAGK